MIRIVRSVSKKAHRESLAETVRALESRLHIFECLVQVLDYPHEFLDVVLAVDEEVDALRDRYGWSEIQAEAALDLEVRRLNTTAQSRIRSEFDGLRLQRARLSES